MNKLDKQTRQTVFHKGIARKPNFNELVSIELQQVTEENGFDKDHQELVKKYLTQVNRSNAMGNKTPKIKKMLESKIEELAAAIRELGYDVSRTDNGIAYVQPTVIRLEI